MKMQFDEEAMRKFKSGAELALAIVAVAGVIGVSLAMPGLSIVIAKGMSIYNRNKDKQIYLRELFRERNHGDTSSLQKARRSVVYLRSRGYVEVIGSGDSSKVVVTRKGLEYISWLDASSIEPIVQTKWDGSWWVVLSDIPTKTHRKQSELLRLRLKSIGFLNMQKSVWVFPYNPTIALNKITSYYGLGRYVTLMRVVAMDDEDGKRLKKHFKLA